MRLTHVVGAAAACRPAVPLAEVPVRGATPREEALVRAELAAFEAAVGAGRLTLREVAFVDTIRGDEDVAGAYHAGRVLLTREDRPTDTLRHELCHAVHQQEDLLREPDPLLDTLAAGLFTGTEVYAEALRHHYRTPRRQREEAMAAFCELGPVVLDALATPCPGEAPLAAEVAAWMASTVYVARPPAEPVAPAAPTTLDAWLRFGFTDVAGTDVPGVVSVEEGGGARSTWRLQDGAPGDPAAAPLPAATDAPWFPGPVTGALGWPTGPGAVRGRPSLLHLGWAGSRLWATDAGDDGWRVVEGSCAPPVDEVLFTADGAVWRAWTEGLAVRWAPL